MSRKHDRETYHLGVYIEVPSKNKDGKPITRRVLAPDSVYRALKPYLKIGDADDHIYIFDIKRESPYVLWKKKREYLEARLFKGRKYNSSKKGGGNSGGSGGGSSASNDQETKKFILAHYGLMPGVLLQQANLKWMDERTKARQQYDRDKLLAKTTGQPLTAIMKADKTKIRKPRERRHDYGLGLTEGNTLPQIKNTIRREYGPGNLDILLAGNPTKIELLREVEKLAQLSQSEAIAKLEERQQKLLQLPNATATADSTAAAEKKQSTAVPIAVLADSSQKKKRTETSFRSTRVFGKHREQKSLDAANPDTTARYNLRSQTHDLQTVLGAEDPMDEYQGFDDDDTEGLALVEDDADEVYESDYQ